jgi:hypothetical protein
VTIKACCCCCGSGLDRVAPTFVVGNVPEGDSATAYSTDGFEYVPDTGNGAGIETALNTLSGLGSGGRVYVRRGTYDFTAVGAPVAPLVVDGGVTLSGEGPGTLLIPRDQGNQTLIEMIAGDSALENFKISMPALLPGAVYAGTTEGIIEVSAATTGAVRIENITAELAIDTVANGAVVNRLINLVNDSIMTLITRVTAANDGYHLDGEAVWIRFVGIEQISARNVFITDCYAQNFDAGVTVGLTGLCEIKGLICTGFGRRYVHQMASDTQARVTIIGGYGTADDADAIGLNLHSHQDANAEVQGLRLLSLDAVQPAARIRSAANAGHAIFTGCSFTWPHVGGAVVEIGTSGSANPCNRNTINGCHFHNTDVAGIGIQVFNATSVDNILVNNSLEAATLISDAGTTTQIANNI